MGSSEELWKAVDSFSASAPKFQRSNLPSQQGVAPLDRMDSVPDNFPRLSTPLFTAIEKVPQLTALGTCSECGYSPIAPGAKACPRCGSRNPNPSVADRFVGVGMLLGIASGVLGGGAYGFFFPKEDAGPIATAVAVGLVAGIPGLILGLIGGIGLASVAWLMGKR